MENTNRIKLLSATSLLMAVLQSICTAVLTISGIRLAIGLTAFALSGSIFAPVRWFHQDAIRIPMLALATLGAVVDLAVLAWMRSLRARSSARWRQRERDNKEKRSERLQLALAVLTLILVGVETWIHYTIVHPVHPPAPAMIRTFAPPAS